MAMIVEPRPRSDQDVEMRVQSPAASFPRLPEELFRYILLLACKLPYTAPRRASRRGESSSSQSHAPAQADGSRSQPDEIRAASPSPPLVAAVSTTSSTRILDSLDVRPVPLDIPTCLAVLRVSRRCHDLVLPLFYRDVTLDRPSRLLAFANTVLRDPARGLLVRSLWVGCTRDSQWLPNIAFHGFNLFLASTVDPHDPYGRMSLRNRPTLRSDDPTTSKLRLETHVLLQRRIVKELVDIDPTLEQYAYPHVRRAARAPATTADEEVEEARATRRAPGQFIGLSAWIGRAEIAQSALQFAMYLLDLCTLACGYARREAATARDASTPPMPPPEAHDNDETHESLMALADTMLSPPPSALREYEVVRPYLDQFVVLVGRRHVRPSWAAATLASQLLRRHAPWWAEAPSHAALTASYGRHRDERADDFTSHLLYARSGRMGLLIPHQGSDPMAERGSEEVTLDDSWDRASLSRVDGDRDGEDDGDEDQGGTGSEDGGGGGGGGPHSSTHGRTGDEALDIADRFGPRRVEWVAPPSLSAGLDDEGRCEALREERAAMALRLPAEALDAHADYTLGSLLATARGLLALTPRVRSLAVSGFLERAVAGERRGADLKALRHLAIGPPPANWSAPLHLRSFGASLRSIDISGCMLFRDEARDLAGQDGALPGLAEVTWTLWLPHSLEHVLSAQQTLRIILYDGADAGARATRRDDGRTPRNGAATAADESSARQGRRRGGGAQGRRRVHAVLHEMDAGMVREAMRLPGPPSLETAAADLAALEGVAGGDGGGTAGVEDVRGGEGQRAVQPDQAGEPRARAGVEAATTNNAPALATARGARADDDAAHQGDSAAAPTAAAAAASTMPARTRPPPPPPPRRAPRPPEAPRLVISNAAPRFVENLAAIRARFESKAGFGREVRFGEVPPS